MKTEQLNRTVPLSCPTCGGQEFEYDEETIDMDGTIRCNNCNLETTKDRLIEENGETIEAAVEEIGAEVMKDLSDTFKKAFKS